MDAIEAIRTRASTRAFVDRPVERELVQAVLETARWAPSGVNIQPWDVAVVSGNTKERIGDAIIAAREAGTEPDPDYAYYPEKWEEPYRSRRRSCGLAMYGALGISKDDRDKQREAWYRNYRFFDAPVGMIFFLDRNLGQGAWLDYGMFLENIMIAARSHGLATCPLASIAEYPSIVREVLGRVDTHFLVCGMALGFPDRSAAVNSYRTEREPVSNFTLWYD